jgi:hypothetical protein
MITNSLIIKNLQLQLEYKTKLSPSLSFGEQFHWGEGKGEAYE